MTEITFFEKYDNVCNLLVFISNSISSIIKLIIVYSLLRKLYIAKKILILALFLISN